MNGKFVSVLKQGRGDDLVFLHGYGSCKESFYYQINFFDDKFRVTAFDFPAFGRSAPLERPWSVGDYADWLKDFLAAEGIERAAFVAHSFGARVAFKLFSARDDLCSRLVVTGGAGIVKPRSAEYIRRVKRYRAIKKFFPSYAERRFGSEEYKKLSPLMRESYKKIVNEDLRQCAGKISCPVLLVYGADDTVTPASEEGRIFCECIKNSRLEATDGGHFCFSQYPEAFNRLVLGFLTE